MNKKQLWAMLGAVWMLSACAPSEAPQATQSVESVKTVAITALVEHPALDAVRQGVIEELNHQGFIEGKNIKIQFQSAQGNTAMAAQIAKQFVGENPDVIVAIATPSAQAVAAATKSVPLVFAAVTDPVAAKLTASWDASGTNVTGVSDNLPLQPQVDLMKRLVPDLKTLGYVYSPGEVNSTIVLEELQKLLPAQNIQLEAVATQRTTDIPMAVKSLQGKAQLIYTSLDNNIVSAYESVYQAAREMKIPLLAADTGSVPRGAVAAMGVNYKTVGIETGKIVADILNGKKAGEIPVVTLQNLDLHLSMQNAEVLGVELSEDLLNDATQIIDDKK